MKNNISAVLRASVSIGLIVLLLYIMRGKYGEIFSALKATNAGTFVMALAIFTAAIFLAAYRMMLIIKAQEIAICFTESVSLSFIGYFFNNFLPTSIGGDVVKGYYLSKKTDDKTGAYTAIFVDRALGLCTMVFMAFVALLFAKADVVDASIRNMIYIITLVSAIMIFFLAHKNFARQFKFLLAAVRPIEHKLKGIYASVNKYRHHKVLIIQSVIISVASQLLYFFSIGFAALSIGSKISVGDILLRMPIVSAISLLPSINGLGVREGSIVLLFGQLIGKEKAFAVSILMLVMLFVLSIVGGIVYMLSPQFRMRLRDAEKVEEEI